ncbi:MAG: alpha/beta hydrolase-fold protein [Kofleriaceae bacterium]
MASRHTDRATVRATYPHDVELLLRGSGAGLSWEVGRSPDELDGATRVFHLDVAHGESIELKVLRGDGAWMAGRNAVIGCGDVLELYPAFDRMHGELLPSFELAVAGGRPLNVRVMLPPSYQEQTELRFPVLYVQDGQSVWSDSSDPFGSWGLDHVLDELWELGAIADVITVAIETSRDRLHLLGPVRDPSFGGGGGGGHLKAIVDRLKPHIDETLRTRSERAATTLMGSSMGGLFSFYAAWERPEVFGGAICLSPSFWWADRFVVRRVDGGACPAPRPRLYLDSGAAASALEGDASTRDGVHVVRAMHRALVGHCYEPGNDLHLLSWTGHRHSPTSWASRVAVPLQLFLPRSV